MLYVLCVVYSVFCLQTKYKSVCHRMSSTLEDAQDYSAASYVDIFVGLCTRLRARAESGWLGQPCLKMKRPQPQPRVSNLFSPPETRSVQSPSPTDGEAFNRHHPHVWESVQSPSPPLSPHGPMTCSPFDTVTIRDFEEDWTRTFKPMPGTI